MKNLVGLVLTGEIYVACVNGICLCDDEQSSVFFTAHTIPVLHYITAISFARSTSIYVAHNLGGANSPWFLHVPHHRLPLRSRTRFEFA